MNTLKKFFSLFVASVLMAPIASAQVYDKGVAPADTYDPPCARGDFYVGDKCWHRDAVRRPSFQEYQRTQMRTVPMNTYKSQSARQTILDRPVTSRRKNRPTYRGYLRGQFSRPTTTTRSVDSRDYALQWRRVRRYENTQRSRATNRSKRRQARERVLHSRLRDRTGR